MWSLCFISDQQSWWLQVCGAYFAAVMLASVSNVNVCQLVLAFAFATPAGGQTGGGEMAHSLAECYEKLLIGGWKMIAFENVVCIPCDQWVDCLKCTNAQGACVCCVSQHSHASNNKCILWTLSSLFHKINLFSLRLLFDTNGLTGEVIN